MVIATFLRLRDAKWRGRSGPTVAHEWLVVLQRRWRLKSPASRLFARPFFRRRSKKYQKWNCSWFAIRCHWMNISQTPFHNFGASELKIPLTHPASVIIICLTLITAFDMSPRSHFLKYYFVPLSFSWIIIYGYLLSIIKGMVATCIWCRARLEALKH